MILDADSGASAQLATQLNHAGFAIELATTPADALDVLGYRVCSAMVVVADRVDDREFQESLMDLRHAAPKAWVLVVTDDPPQRAIQIVRQCGADELLVTPFSVATLVEYLAAHVRLPRPLS